ncbi:MAG: flagellar biosynthesis anti-sigma factor FlgM [Desulfobacterales bacterium]|nr:flagellar biosynthesis anti-sigma factor FlgM [Desulfobacterales bacterium]
MKISNSTTNLINQAYGNNTVHQNAANANAKSERNKETNPSANVDLSSRTKDMQKISQALENEPVAMSEKVIKLKQEVNENRYNIDADKIAGKMVGLLLNEII